MNLDASLFAGAVLFAALAVAFLGGFVAFGASADVISLAYGGGVSAVLAVLFGRAASRARAVRKRLVAEPPPS